MDLHRFPWFKLVLVLFFITTDVKVWFLKQETAVENEEEAVQNVALGVT